MSHEAAVRAILDATASVAPTLRQGLLARRGDDGDPNPSGDRRLEADVWADELFADRLAALDCVGTYASEERADALPCGDGLAVAVDPLDGSSNLRSNNPVGSVVGIYDGDLPATGRHLVAAAYVIYGAVTTMTAAHDG